LDESMTRSFACPALIGLLALGACASPAQQPPEALQRPVDVETLLSAREYREAGLDRLQPGEIESLNRALTRALMTEQDPATARAVEAWEQSADDPAATFGLPYEHPLAGRLDSISARVLGEVRRWEQGSRFELDNGQVWEVRDSRSHVLRRAVENPPVEIRRAALGTYRMAMEGQNPTPRVRRIR
jgi:hypothetical protein